MKDCQFVVTIPVGRDKECENVKQLDKLNTYLNSGYVVTHITSAVIEDNMYVYHWLERETK